MSQGTGLSAAGLSTAGALPSAGVGDVGADLSKFSVIRPSRPMLARDADSVYWMSRYVERSEHLSRMMLMKLYLLADCGDLEEEMERRLWQTVPTVMRGGEVPGTAGAGQVDIGPKVLRWFAFDSGNPNSLISCITAARENARGIREHISAEMWEAINGMYWWVQGEDAPAKYEESQDAYLRQVMSGSLLFQGLTDQTLAHDQRWHFAQMGKHLERADWTSRFVEVHWALLGEMAEELETPIRNINWMSVLRSCCSIEAFRKFSVGDMDPLQVVRFLILEPNYPRSVRYAVSAAYRSVIQIRVEGQALKIDAAERILGRLEAELEYAEVGEMLAVGMDKYLQRLQTRLGEAALEMQKAYFLH